MQTETNVELDLSGSLADDDAGELLGQVLVELGKLDSYDVERIVQYARDKRLRFGEAAKKLKLLTQRDIDNALARQFDYPVLDEGAGGLSDELVTAFRPFSTKSKAITGVRSKLLRFWSTDARKSLALMGAHKKDGCSYLAANLAVVFSQLGHRTLLVDADLQAGRQHEIFNIGNKVGLSAALVGRASLGSVVHELPLFRGLSLLPAGALPPNSSELLERPELFEFVEQLCGQFQVVLFDTPPASANGGTEFAAGACGNAIAVVRKNRTRMSDAKALLDNAESAGANIVGSVMTDF